MIDLALTGLLITGSLAGSFFLIYGVISFFRDMRGLK